MSAAVGVGLLVAYPVNVWMVEKGLKHGMGTQRALGKGGHSMDAERARWEAEPNRARGRDDVPVSAAATRGRAHR
jgi:hypothetical protein